MRNNFHMAFAYYPEHWPEERWATDMRMMHELGTTAVRIAEFAWCRMEPEEGHFEFDWLDRFIALASEYEIKIILCTPTAAPPPWASETYPDILLVKEDGRHIEPVARRYTCPTSPNYRSLAYVVIEQMATRYGDHPSVIGWQTDNEVNGAVCHCENCRNACREWLKDKYGTVEAFNKALGLVFWSHELTDWNQVTIPRPAGEALRGDNPSRTLEKHLFASHAWTQFLGHQVDLIRRHSPGRWVTHNLPGYNVNFDLFDMAAAHDFLSLDLYPKAMLDQPPHVDFGNDITRSVQDRPHWIMELQTGSPCTGFYKAPIPRPGQLRLWAHQCAAHGAEGVTFFRWRKSPCGIEMLGNGLLDQDGRAGRRFEEVKHLGSEFRRLSDILPTYDAPREVAILFDFADKIHSQTHQYKIDMGFMPHLHHWYRAARRLGLNLRFARPTDDLSPYRIVLAPWQMTTSDEIVENLTRYVQAGGTLVGSLRMGFFDVHGKASQQVMPGGMTELFGVQVDEYERVMTPNPNRVIFLADIGEPAECRDWNYLLSDLGAKPLGTYERDYYAGRTAASINEAGSGRAAYLGTVLGADDLKRFVGHLANLAGLDLLPADWPEDVESIRLTGPDGGPIRVLLNHSPEPRTVSPPTPARDLLNDRESQEIELDPLGVRWLGTT